MIGIVERFKQLVPIANPSGEEADIRKFIQETLFSLAIEQQYVDEAGNLLAIVPGNPNKNPILLSAHMDSVPPCNGIMPVEDHENHRTVIRSGGKTILGADDKAGIAVMLNLIEKLHANGYNDNHPLELLFSVQEETGLVGLKRFDIGKLRSGVGYVLDGEGFAGDIFYAGPSQKNLRFEFEGIRAHAGIKPESGVSAIDMAVHTCARLLSGRLDSETTMNIGTINGGDALNIVAPSTTVYAEARSHNTNNLEALIYQIKTTCNNVETMFKGGKIHLIVTDRYSLFEVPQTHCVISKAARACEATGITPDIKRMNIGSDAHVLNHCGIPTVVLGMGFHYSHSLGEFIYIDELIQVSEIVWHIVQGD